MGKILIIDDDEAIRNSMRELLLDCGYEVFVASNGQEGIEKLHDQATRPDLILLDLMMPIKDGLEFRREQQADPAVNNIPVIFMSADGYARGKQMATNASDYIKKPFDVNAMLEKIGKYIH